MILHKKITKIRATELKSEAKFINEKQTKYHFATYLFEKHFRRWFYESSFRSPYFQRICMKKRLVFCYTSLWIKIIVPKETLYKYTYNLKLTVALPSAIKLVKSEHSRFTEMEICSIKTYHLNITNAFNLCFVSIRRLISTCKIYILLSGKWVETLQEQQRGNKSLWPSIYLPAANNYSYFAWDRIII